MRESQEMLSSLHSELVEIFLDKLECFVEIL